MNKNVDLNKFPEEIREKLSLIIQVMLHMSVSVAEKNLMLISFFIPVRNVKVYCG